MKENLQENIKNFGSVIELDKPISNQEAIQKLMQFHNVPAENILKAFGNLQNHPNCTVILRKGISNGSECISMNGYDNDKWLWNELIDIHSGQPIEHTG